MTIWNRGLLTAIMGVGLVLANVGCGLDKPADKGGKMSGDKMGGDKMGGDKMGGDKGKMTGDKMTGDK